MKKYITIAALLAAGTAFANADTTTLQDADKVVASNTGYNTQSGTFSVALTLDVAELRTLLEQGQTKAWGTDIVSYNCNGTLTGVTVNGGSTSAGLISTSGLYARWGTNTVWGNVRWDGSTDLADLNGSDAEGTGWDSVAYAGLVYTHSTTGGTSVAFTLLKADKTAIVDSYVTASDLKSKDATIAALTFDDSVKVSYYFNQALSESTAKSFAVAAAVPEPSAFGLLAGLGALALVASRRRRK